LSAPDFTPGEWSVNGTAIEAEVHGTSIVIAHVYDDREGVPEFEANAHVMSAAKELYAALEKCLAYCEREGGVGNRIAQRDHKERVAEARAALKKARGE
jgi:hypothetical protein